MIRIKNGIEMNEMTTTSPCPLLEEGDKRVA